MASGGFNNRCFCCVAASLWNVVQLKMASALSILHHLPGALLVVPGLPSGAMPLCALSSGSTFLIFPGIQFAVCTVCKSILNPRNPLSAKRLLWTFLLSSLQKCEIQYLKYGQQEQELPASVKSFEKLARKRS